MRLGEVVKPHQYAIFNRLLGSKVWQRDAQEFSPIDRDVLFRTIVDFESTNNAQKAINLVITKLKSAVIAGEIDYIRVDNKNYLKKLVTEEEFLTKLEKFTDVRRDCLMFALEMNWSIEKAVAMERSDIKTYQVDMNKRAVEIIERQPIPMFRQKRTVFWEMVHNEQRMLISLRHQFVQIFDMNWRDLLNQYDRLAGTFFLVKSKQEALDHILQRNQFETGSELPIT